MRAAPFPTGILSNVLVATLASLPRAPGHRARAPRRALGEIGIRLCVVACALLVTLESRLATAQAVLPSGFTDQCVVTDLRNPVSLAFLPDGRLLFVEKITGRIRFIAGGALGMVDPAAQVDSVQSSHWEQGLLGIAVDPQWPARPYVYVSYDALDSTLRIARFTASGDLDSPTSGNLTLASSSRFDVLRDIPDRIGLHNGGTLRFGPDGMLYASIGDDGTMCGAQDTTSLRGVILRLDVQHLPSAPGGPADKAMLVAAGNPFATHPNPNARLVWAMGFRNPFRFHVDPVDGSLFVGDVGSARYEEIDHVAAPGADFGWPFFEGPASGLSSCGSQVPGSVTVPIYAYDRSGFTFSSSSAVMSAGVYRAGPCPNCNFPAEYEGNYFFSDFYEGFMRRLEFSGGAWRVAAPVLGQQSANWGEGFHDVCDYLMGSDGALWYAKFRTNFVNNSGEIRRISYVTPQLSVSPAHGSEVTFAAPVPSPARGTVRLAYGLPRDARVELAIFDGAGRRLVQVVAPALVRAGSHVTTWNAQASGGHRVAPAVYFARLNVDGICYTRRVPVLR